MFSRLPALNAVLTFDGLTGMKVLSKLKRICISIVLVAVQKKILLRYYWFS
jgi:hypothetical protein